MLLASKTYPWTISIKNFLWLLQIYCNVFYYLCIVMVLNMTIGGLGISYYRLLYVKASNWVKYKLGENNLLLLILFCWFFSTFIFTIIFGSGQGSRANINMCLGYYKELVKKKMNFSILIPLIVFKIKKH